MLRDAPLRPSTARGHEPYPNQAARTLTNPNNCHSTCRASRKRLERSMLISMFSRGIPRKRLTRGSVNGWLSLTSRLANNFATESAVSGATRFAGAYLPRVPHRTLLQQGVVREVLSLRLESGQAAQVCVPITQLDRSGGTEAARVAEITIMHIRACHLRRGFTRAF